MREQYSRWGWGGKTSLRLGSIPCRILGKHHTPMMGGDLSLYRPDTAWSTRNTIQDHIQLYISNNYLLSLVGVCDEGSGQASPLLGRDN
jgi:hypothetical protein